MSVKKAGKFDISRNIIGNIAMWLMELYKDNIGLTREEDTSDERSTIV